MDSSPQVPQAPGTTREQALADFGREVVGAMDEIAELIFATRLMSDSVADHQRQGLHKTAQPLSTKVERALHAVRGDLLEAIRLGAREGLAERLRQVRRSNALRLAQAGKDAASLAAMTVQALDPGRLSTPTSPALAVQQRIERVVAAWATL